MSHSQFWVVKSMLTSVCLSSTWSCLQGLICQGSMGQEVCWCWNASFLMSGKSKIHQIILPIFLSSAQFSEYKANYDVEWRAASKKAAELNSRQQNKRPHSRNEGKSWFQSPSGSKTWYLLLIDVDMSRADAWMDQVVESADIYITRTTLMTGAIKTHLRSLIATLQSEQFLERTVLIPYHGGV